PVTLDQITTASWATMAQSFGAAVDPPPDDPIQMMQSGTLQKSIDQFTFSSLMFDLPEGYTVTSGDFSAQVHIGDGDFNSGHRAQVGLQGEGYSGEFPHKDGAWSTALSAATIVGRSGNVSLVYNYYNVESGSFIASIQASPSPAAMRAWQMKVWDQL